MKKLQALLAVLLTVSMPGVIFAEQIRASLVGYQEVPSVSTAARGHFRAMINRGDESIDYELTYDGLQGTMQQSHIHIAQPGVNGSIVLWLCQTATTPAPAAVVGLTPFCPGQGGTVTGTLTSANVIAGGTASQQLAAGELEEVVAAIRAGVAYVNVHTTPLSPGGEIRGQISASNR